MWNPFKKQDDADKLKEEPLVGNAHPGGIIDAQCEHAYDVPAYIPDGKGGYVVGVAQVYTYKGNQRKRA